MPMLTVAFLVGLAVPVTLVVVMFLLGVNLVLSDVHFSLRRTRLCLFVTGLQFALLVPCAIIVAKLLDVDAVLAMTLIAIAAAPGGTFSNVLTFLARGNLALSVVLTTASMVLATFVSPALMVLAVRALHLDTGMTALEFAAVARDLAFFVLLPVSAGMLVSGCAPALAAMIKRLSSAITSVAILGLIVMAAIVSASHFLQALLTIVVAGGMLTVFSMGIGLVVSRIGQVKDRSSIVLEFGVRNLPIALVLLEGLGPDARMVAYLLSHFIVSTTISLAAILLLRAKAGPATA